MNKLQQDVIDFHEAMGQPIGIRPRMPGVARLTLRAGFVAEESAELLRAIAEGRSLADIAQEAIDLAYVTMGLMVECGVDFQAVWDEVHAANMQKRPNPDGGKVLKPPGWEPPNVTEVLRAQRPTWLF